MKIGDKVTSKNGFHQGRVKYVYGNSFVEVVWNCNKKYWIGHASQKELINDLVKGWITGQDLIDTRYENDIF